MQMKTSTEVLVAGRGVARYANEPRGRGRAARPAGSFACAATPPPPPPPRRLTSLPARRGPQENVGAAAGAGAGQGAAGAGAGPAVVFLHLRLRHLRGVQRERLLLGELQRKSQHHRHGAVRLPVPVEPGRLHAAPGRAVQQDGAGGGAPGGRLLLLGPVLRHRRRLRLPLQHGRPRRLPGLLAPLPGGGREAAHGGLRGHRGLLLPVAGEHLGLGQGPDGRQDLHGGPPAPLQPPRRRLLPRGGQPHGQPQRLRGFRLSQPGALGRQLLVRLQGDRPPPPRPHPPQRPPRHLTPPKPPKIPPPASPPKKKFPLRFPPGG